MIRKIKLLITFCFLFFTLFVYAKKTISQDKKNFLEIKELYKSGKYEKVIERLINLVDKDTKYKKKYLKFLRKAGKKLKKNIIKRNKKYQEQIIKIVEERLKKKNQAIKKAIELKDRGQYNMALNVLNIVDFSDPDIENLKDEIKEDLRRAKELKIKRKQFGPIIAKKYFNDAKKLYEEGYFMEALRLLNKASALHKFKEEEEFKAICREKFLFWKNNFGKESSFFEQVRGFFDKGVDAYLKENWKLALLNFKKVEEAYLSPVISKYIDYINREIENENKKKQAEVIVKEIKLLYKQGKLDEAYDRVKEIKDLFWDNVEFGELVEDIENALKARELVKKGDKFRKRGEYLSSIETYQKALYYNVSFVNKEAEAKIKNIANMKKTREKDKKLISLWSEIYKNPDKRAVIEKIRNVYKEKKIKKKELLSKKKKEEMIRKKKEEEEKRKKEIQEKLRKAKQYFSEKKYQKAYNISKEVIDMEPKNKEAKDIMKKAKVEIKKQEAIRKQAIAKAVEKHYKQGLVYYTQEKYKEAILEWKKVLELDPKNERALKNIKAAQTKLGE